MRNLKVSEINVKNFKGIFGEKELKIAPKVTVIYGRNAHGKTSLLEALWTCMLCFSSNKRQQKTLLESKDLVNKHAEEAKVTVYFEPEGYLYTAIKNSEPGCMKNMKGPFSSVECLEISDFVKLVRISDSSLSLAKATGLEEYLKERFGVNEINALIKHLQRKLQDIESFQEDVEQILEEKERTRGILLNYIETLSQELNGSKGDLEFKEDMDIPLEKIEDELKKVAAERESLTEQMPMRIPNSVQHLRELEKKFPELSRKKIGGIKQELIKKNEEIAQLERKLIEVSNLKEKFTYLLNNLSRVNELAENSKIHLNALQSVYKNGPDFKRRIEEISEKIEYYTKVRNFLKLKRYTMENFLEYEDILKSGEQTLLGIRILVEELRREIIKTQGEIDKVQKKVDELEGDLEQAQKVNEDYKHSKENLQRDIKEIIENFKYINDNLDLFEEVDGFLKTDVEKLERLDIDKTLPQLLAPELDVIIQKLAEWAERLKKYASDLLNKKKIELEEIEEKIKSLKKQQNKLQTFKSSVEEYFSPNEDISLSELIEKLERKEKELLKIQKEQEYLEKKKEAILKHKDFTKAKKEFEKLEEHYDNFLEETENLQQLPELEELSLLKKQISNSIEKLKRFKSFLVNKLLTELNEYVQEFFKSAFFHPHARFSAKIVYDAEKDNFKLQTSQEGKDVPGSQSMNDSLELAVEAAISVFESRRNPKALNLFVIDEIQQHYDSDNREKIAGDFIPKIAQEQQVVIATSDGDFFQKLKKALLREGEEENSIFYEITFWSQYSGPTIKRT